MTHSTLELALMMMRNIALVGAALSLLVRIPSWLRQSRTQTGARRIARPVVPLALLLFSAVMQLGMWASSAWSAAHAPAP